MGSGKTLVGGLVAQRAKVPFFDLDFMIENKAGMAISDIFATKNEAAFRAIEAQLLPEALQPGAVTALGGGTPIPDSNWALIRERAITVYLEASFGVIWERVRGIADRPLVSSRTREQLQALLEERRPRYEEATHRVDADRPAGAVAAEVLQIWSG